MFLPFFLLRNLLFDYRRSRAVREAKRRSIQLGRNVYVFQVGRRFKVGTREELRRVNSRERKRLKRITGSRLLNFDYRNSVVYVATNGLMLKAGYKVK
jgi:hypothetical protein